MTTGAVAELRNSEWLLAADPKTCADSIEDGTMLDALVDEVRTHQPEADVELLNRAFVAARDAHSGQLRRSGEPYLVHPVRVAQLIARLGLDTGSVVAGLLHDAVEDSELSVYELSESFGRQVANIVDGVTKLGKIPYLSRKEQQAESFRKMLLAMSQDVRVLLVKLADRLDNMRTLEHMPAEKRERISRETMEIYAPLANRLGIEWMRRELQDLSFRHLEPAAFQSIRGHMDRLLEQYPDFIPDSLKRLRGVFDGAHGDAEDAELGRARWSSDGHGEVEVRATLRSPFRIQSKRQQTGRRIEQVSDLVTYQIITRDRAACYAALGALHSHFKPVPGRIRDYIALPRPNQYRALHTAVINRLGVRMEVQLRSRQMDAIAERGILAARRHGSDAAHDEDQPRELAFIGQLMDWQQDVTDPNEFIEAVKADLFADEVYVFTPEGDIYTFPKGATPIDFAFAIHSDVGMHCSGARVNGHVVPLRYHLRQGDTVEILTNPESAPRPEWLKMSATARARARIKHYLRQQERKRLRAVGRSLVEQEVGSRAGNLQDLERLAERAEALGLRKESRDADGVYEAVGAGQITARSVADALVPAAGTARTPSEDRNLLARMLRRVVVRAGVRPGDTGPGADQGGPTSPIEVTRERVIGSGGGGPMIQLAPCCSPVPGDPLLGFFEPGSGIVAHVQSCPEALEQVLDRRVYLAWADGLELERPVTLEVRTANAVGLLAEMSRVFSDHGVDIKQANCRALEDGERAINTFYATVNSLRQLESLMLALRGIPGVIAVERVYTHGSAVYPHYSS